MSQMQGLVAKLCFHYCHNCNWSLNKTELAKCCIQFCSSTSQYKMRQLCSRGPALIHGPPLLGYCLPALGRLMELFYMAHGNYLKDLQLNLLPSVVPLFNERSIFFGKVEKDSSGKCYLAWIYASLYFLI